MRNSAHCRRTRGTIACADMASSLPRPGLSPSVVPLAVVTWALACLGAASAAPQDPAAARDAAGTRPQTARPQVPAAHLPHGPPPGPAAGHRRQARRRGVEPRASGRATTRSRCPPRGAAPSDDRAQDPVRRPQRLLRDPRVRRSGAGPSLPRRRDDFTGDIVGVCFDSYFDKRTGFEFDLTAGGTKIDLVLGNGETEWDMSWDAVWDGKVGPSTPTGWIAEFRIPLSQLRYGTQDEQVWGLHAWRWIDRNQEEDQWQLIPRKNTRAHVQPRRAARHPRPAAPRGTSSCCRTPSARSSAPTPTDAATAAERHGTAGLDAKVGAHHQLHARRHRQPRLRPGRGRPVGRQPHRLRDVLRGEAALLPRGQEDLELRPRGQRPLFYTRRIGAGPVLRRRALAARRDGPTSPESTTILSAAAKVTGKTPDGLSVGILQSVTPKETAHGSRRGVERREQRSSPSATTTVGRAAEGLGQGQHRPRRDADEHPSLERAIPRWRSCRRRAHGRGRLRALLLEPVLRPRGEGRVQPGHRRARGHHGAADRTPCTSTSVRTRPPRRRRRAPRRSPATAARSVRPLRTASGAAANRPFPLGLAGARPERPRVPPAGRLPGEPGVPARSEPTRRALPQRSVNVAREDAFDFGGLRTDGMTSSRPAARSTTSGRSAPRSAFDQADRHAALRGGPSLRWHDFWGDAQRAATRRAAFWSPATGRHGVGRHDDSRILGRGRRLKLRLSSAVVSRAHGTTRRISTTSSTSTTVETADGPRYVLGRIDQDT